jgi:hypothetical protein
VDLPANGIFEYRYCVIGDCESDVPFPPSSPTPPSDAKELDREHVVWCPGENRMLLMGDRAPHDFFPGSTFAASDAAVAHADSDEAALLQCFPVAGECHPYTFSM